MSNFKLPSLSVDLIPILEQVFPNRCPDIIDTDRGIWFKAGQHSVVEYLKSRFLDNEEGLDDILSD